MEPVLLVNCPRESSPQPLGPVDKRMPLGLLYISAVLKSAGIACQVLDAEARNLGVSDILREAATLQPALIGLNCHTLNRRTVYEIARSLKVLLPTALICLGGPHPTLAPVHVLQECDAADAVVPGEGEMTCLQIAQGGGDLGSVPGLYIRNGGRIVSTGRRQRLPDLDALPYPDTTDIPLSDYLSYADANLPGLWKRAYIAASRGCKYRCSFCTEWSAWGSRATFRSAASVLSEIAMYQDQYGVDRFYFYDDTFTDWPEYKDFCAQAQRSRIEWSCSTRIDHLTAEVIHILAEGGCREIAVGLESGSRDMLQAINKEWELRMTGDQVASAISKAAAAGIRVRAHFMLGFPWEARDDITGTVRFAVALKQASLTDANFFTVKAYPGTQLASRLARTSDPGIDLTEGWSVHDSAATRNPRVAAKLRRFNDIARYQIHPHLDSLSVRALARKAWEIFFSDAQEADVERLLWDGIAWQ